MVVEGSLVMLLLLLLLWAASSGGSLYLGIKVSRVTFWWRCIGRRQMVLVWVLMLALVLLVLLVKAVGVGSGTFVGHVLFGSIQVAFVGGGLGEIEGVGSVRVAMVPGGLMFRMLMAVAVVMVVVVGSRGQLGLAVAVERKFGVRIGIMGSSLITVVVMLISVGIRGRRRVLVVVLMMI